MKKILSLMVVMLLFSSVLVFAQNDAKPIEEVIKGSEAFDPGTTPDNFFYFMDKAFDNLALALTFNTDARVEKELRVAEERLAEARAMALSGNYEAMAEAQVEHDNVLDKLKGEVKEISDVDPVTELKKELEVEKKIKKHTDRVKEFKDEISVKIKISGDITSEQQDLIASILASLEGRTGEIVIEIDNEKGKTKTKIEEETGRSGEEVENELEEEDKSYDYENEVKDKDKSDDEERESKDDEKSSSSSDNSDSKDSDEEDDD